jgi:hypothetical protein
MRNFIKSCPENLPVHVFHFSEDMTTWAQRFVIQSFSQLLKPHSEIFSKINAWSQFVLSKFTKKRIELPAKLLAEISELPEMRYGAELESMNTLKKRLLDKDFEGVIENEIGMWMGILHYTSSHYHLCLISLLQRVFNDKLEKMSHEGDLSKDIVKQVKHNSYVSSDDRYRSLRHKNYA